MALPIDKPLGLGSEPHSTPVDRGCDDGRRVRAGMVHDSADRAPREGRQGAGDGRRRPHESCADPDGPMRLIGCFRGFDRDFTEPDARYFVNIF
jgi:hypothetical protein